ncbi:hypothetical protein B5P44_00360 [Mycobacterium sp. CBMA 213]|nr:hypothetical protein [Mycolicibacterium sp. CBMA 335]MUM03275.1 hypothetical protein [Mycolicibacterium sp. CBMA 213]
MMGVVGMTSFAGMAGSTAVLEGMQAQLAAFAAANTAAAAALTPPGSEGASAVAMAQQQASEGEFAANFALALEQMTEFNGTLTAASTATQIMDAGNALSV